MKNQWNLYGGYSSSYYVDMISMGYTAKDGDSFSVQMRFNTMVSLYTARFHLMFKLPVKNHWNVYGGYSSSYYVDMITMGYTGKEGDSFYVPMHFNTIVSLYKGYKLSISSIIFTITCEKPVKYIRWLFVLILCGYDNHGLHRQGRRFVLCSNAL